MYGKIYEQTFTGSMYGSGSHIFSVWSYVIAHTKPDAMVELNPVALASILGEEISKVEAAIKHFTSPDPRSRSKEFDGARLIKKGEFIYFVPQYHKYHGFANNKERREYFAQKKREQRQRDKQGQTVKSKSVKECQSLSTNQIHSTDTEIKVSLSKRKASSSEEVKAYARTVGVSDSDAEGFYDSQESGGWKRGGEPLADWKASLRTWKRMGWLASQKSQSHSPQPYREQGQRNMLKLYPAPKGDAYKPLPPPAPPMSEEELAKQREIVREASEKLKQQFKMP